MAQIHEAIDSHPFSLSDPSSREPTPLTSEEQTTLFSLVRGAQQAFFQLSAMLAPPSDLIDYIEGEQTTALMQFAPKESQTIDPQWQTPDALIAKIDQGKAAFHLLTLSYLPMVIRRAQRRNNIFDSGELVSLLSEGLMKAVARYNPSIGARFPTYAIPIMHYTVMDELRAQSFLSRSAMKRISDIMSIQQDLEEKGHQGDLTEQIADRLNLSIHQVTQALSAFASLQRVSLDAPVKGLEDDDITLGDTIPDSNSLDPLDAIIQQEEPGDYEALRKAIASLPEREQFIIDLYYHGVANLRELAPLVGVSETRVLQILKRGIFMLRSLLTP